MEMKSLLLIWRDRISRLYFHIGTLTYDGKIYQFEYTHQIEGERRVHDAINHGYSLHPAFPDLMKKYKSEKLFPAFARRIPSEDRVDYKEVLQELGLPKSASKMDLLRATRGMVGKDPYFFDEPLHLHDQNILSNYFYISGMRYIDLPKNWNFTLKKGDKLYLEQAPSNPVDPNAVKILTKNGIHLGYVPGVFAKAISALIERKVQTNVYVDEIKPTFSPQWWIRVKFESILDQSQTTEEIDSLKGLVVSAA